MDTRALILALSDRARTRRLRAELAECLQHCAVPPCTAAERAAELARLAERWGIGAAARSPAELETLCCSCADPGFPAALRCTPDPPALLFYVGDLSLTDRPAVAIVGSRRAGPASLALAHDIARDLALAGLVVVSGMARGVDGAAHRGALAVAGKTIAVLGSGVLRPFPSAHHALFRAITASGLVLSEYTPSTPPQRQYFPERNRIISGLARGVVVIEAGERSGSLVTARQALEQGRDVMVVPGAVQGGRFAGSHVLLRDGAALVENARDVLAALGIDAPEPTVERTLLESDPLLVTLDDRPRGLEELAQRAGMSEHAIRARLAALELEGVVARTPHGYIRVR